MMSYVVLLVAVLCVFAFGARADDEPAPVNPSLFFTSQEAAMVETLAAKNPHPAASNGDVHLGAVMYYSPEDWVVWLQGERWTPETQHPDLHIIEVLPDRVRLGIALQPNLPLREVTLRPYQTYQLSSRRVVEGSGAVPSVSK